MLNKRCVSGLSPRIYLIILLTVFGSSSAVLQHSTATARQHKQKQFERTSDRYEEKLKQSLKRSTDEVKYLETNGRWTADRFGG